MLVIGGGVAGMTAALRAAELGADVVLVDDGPELGGAALAGEGADAGPRAGRSASAPPGSRCWRRPRRSASSTASSRSGRGSTLHQIRAERHVAATGSIEQPLMFEGNDLPGVMLCSGAERLAAPLRSAAGQGGRRRDDGRPRPRVGPRPARGRRRDRRRRRLARQRGRRRSCSARIEARADPALRGSAVVRAFGRRRVTGAVVAELDRDGRRCADTERDLDCDLIAVSGGTVPATSLLLQAGGQGALGRGRRRLPARRAMPAGIHAAGAVAGHASRGQRRALGRRRRSRGGALARPRRARPTSATRRRARGAWPSGAEPSTERRPAASPAQRARTQEKCFACLCEDVTTNDISYAIDEGFDSLELLKRYTTVTMGPCQGRMCQLAAIRQIAADTGTAVAEVGLTTARPPWSTVPMGALAGRPFEPAKRSAVHGRHRELGGNVLWAGDWRRPYDYGDPEGETMAVHEGAGLIDVSTLGKLIVGGPRRRRLPQPPLPEPLRQPEAGPDPLRGPRRRRRPDHRRRHHLPPRRRAPST